MADEPNSFGGRAEQGEVKRMRREHPSGWLELSMYESLALMIDAIVDAPPGYSFTNPELASRAGVSDESVRNHVGTLEELGVVIPSDESNKYEVNEESRVLREIFGLNDAVNAVRSGADVSVPRSEEALMSAIIRAFEERDESSDDDDGGQESPPLDLARLRSGPVSA